MSKSNTIWREKKSRNTIFKAGTNQNHTQNEQQNKKIKTICLANIIFFFLAPKLFSRSRNKDENGSRIVTSAGRQDLVSFIIQWLNFGVSQPRHSDKLGSHSFRQRAAMRRFRQSLMLTDCTYVALLSAPYGAQSASSHSPAVARSYACAVKQQQETAATRGRWQAHFAENRHENESSPNFDWCPKSKEPKSRSWFCFKKTHLQVLFSPRFLPLDM